MKINIKHFVILLILFIVLVLPAAASYFYSDFESTPQKGISQRSAAFTNINGTYGMVYKENNTYYMFTGSGTDSNIHVHNGTDGVNWNPAKIIIYKNTTTWNKNLVYCPVVWKENKFGHQYHMIYTALNTSGSPTNATVAYAYADVIDGPWTTEANPVFVNNYSFGRNAENWGIIEINDTYYLWVNNFATPDQTERQNSLLTSTDLHNWTPDAQNPIFTGQRFCAWEFKWNGMYYLILPKQYNGTDYAALELYQCTDPRFHVADRKFMGVVMPTYRNITNFDGGDLDTPAFIVTDTMGAGMDLGSSQQNITWYYDVQRAGGGAHVMSMFTLDTSMFDNTGMFIDVWNETKGPGSGYTVSTDWANTGVRSLKIQPAVHENASYLINQPSGIIDLWFNQSGQSVVDLYLKSYDHSFSPANPDFPLLCNFEWNSLNATNGEIKYSDANTTLTGTFKPVYNTKYELKLFFDYVPQRWGWSIFDASGNVLETQTNLSLMNTATNFGQLFFSTNGGNPSPLYIDDINVTNDRLEELYPVASFEQDAADNYSLLSNFADTSTGSPTSWYWNFGDSIGSISRNPSHVYQKAGTYSVVFTAFNFFGNNTITTPLTITYTDTNITTLTQRDVTQPLSFKSTNSSVISITNSTVPSILSGLLLSVENSANSGYLLLSLIVLVMAAIGILRYLGYI